MITRRLETVACAAALTMTACGGAPATASPAAGNVESRTAPASSGRPIDPSKVKGRLPPEVIQQVVRDNFDGMKRCYEAGLGRDPALKGKITTKFVIERDGTVSTAADVHDAPQTEPPNVPAEMRNDFDVRRQAEEPRFPDAKVTACVVSRFKALKFPQPQGGIVTVVYPIVFQPGE